MKGLIFSFALFLSFHLSAQNIELYGLWYDGTFGIDSMGNPTQEGEQNFLKVNPFTGEKTTLSEVEGIEAIVVGSSTYNQGERAYIFWGVDSDFDQKLITLSTLTGAIINDPMISDTPVELQYDLQTDQVFGLVRNDPITYFSSIDIENGSSSFVAPINNFNGISVGSSTMDSNNGIYYMAASQAGYQLFLTGINTSDGSISSQVALPENHYLNELEYDNQQDKLYGIYRINTNGSIDAKLVEIEPITGAIVSELSVNSVFGFSVATSFYDQQSSTYGFVGVDNSGQSSIYLYNMNENELLSITPIDYNFIEIEVDNFNFAQAFYNLTSNPSIEILPSDWTLFPNPATDFLTIQTQAKSDSADQIQLISSSGQILAEYSFETSLQIPVEALSRGTYGVQLLKDGKVVGAKRFVRL